MGINKQTDLEGELQIGPTSLGLVRIYVSGQEVDLPMDFTPEEAREIAAELVDAADRAAASGSGGKPKQAAAPSRNKQTRAGTPAKSGKDHRQPHGRTAKQRPAAGNKHSAPGQRRK